MSRPREVRRCATASRWCGVAIITPAPAAVSAAPKYSPRLSRRQDSRSYSWTAWRSVAGSLGGMPLTFVPRCKLRACYKSRRPGRRPLLHAASEASKCADTKNPKGVCCTGRRSEALCRQRREGEWAPVPCTSRNEARVVCRPTHRDESDELEVAPRRWDEQAGERVERITIRHAGDVIGHSALDVLLCGDPLMLRGHAVGMGFEVLEELPEDALGFLVLGLGRPGQIDVVEHELPQGVRGLEHGTAHRHLGLAVRRDDDVVDHRVEALGAVVAECGADVGRQVRLGDDPRAHRIVDVVVEIRDLVGVADDPALGRLRFTPGRRLEPALGRSAVFEDAVARLLREPETLPVVFELLGDPYALLVVSESLREEAREDLLPDVTERRVPDVVPERHRLDEVLVEPQRAGDRAADLIHLEDVRQARAVVIADGRKEDLCLVLRAPERFAVDDAIAVDRERHPRWRWLVRSVPLALQALRGVRSERRVLKLFTALADAERRNAAIAREVRGALNFGGHVAAKTSGGSATPSQDGQRERAADLDLRAPGPPCPRRDESSPERRLDPPVLVLTQQPAQVSEPPVARAMHAMRRHQQREAPFGDRAAPRAVGGDNALVRRARDRAELLSAAAEHDGKTRCVHSRGLK